MGGGFLFEKNEVSTTCGSGWSEGEDARSALYTSHPLPQVVLTYPSAFSQADLTAPLCDNNSDLKTIKPSWSFFKNCSSMADWSAGLNNDGSNGQS
jgi:hypothetical protein